MRKKIFLLIKMCKKYTFQIVCVLLITLTFLLLVNLWIKFFPSIYFDRYVTLLFFSLLGLSLLPFADKIKIGSVLEIQRLKDKIENVELTQYLGEVIETPQGDTFYYDNEGKHSLPDEQTENFLKTNKGKISVSGDVVSRMKSSRQFESVLKGKKIKWGEHIFVILNKKKFWMTVPDLADYNISEDQIKNMIGLDDEQIKNIPSGHKN